MSREKFWGDSKKNRGEVFNLTAACSVGIGRARGCACIHARPLNGTAGCFFLSQHGVDYGCCTAHACPYAKRIYGTIPSTGTALHTCVSITYLNLTICQTQDSVRADEGTGATTHTFLLLES